MKSGYSLDDGAILPGCFLNMGVGREIVAWLGRMAARQGGQEAYRFILSTSMIARPVMAEKATQMN